MFNFLHLQENLLYVQSQKPFAPDLIYHIMSANSVFIRSTYWLNAYLILSYARGSFRVNLYKMIRFLLEIFKKYTKLAKIVKISILKWNLQPIGLSYEL